MELVGELAMLDKTIIFLLLTFCFSPLGYSSCNPDGSTAGSFTFKLKCLETNKYISAPGANNFAKVENIQYRIGTHYTLKDQGRLDYSGKIICEKHYTTCAQMEFKLVVPSAPFPNPIIKKFHIFCDPSTSKNENLINGSLGIDSISTVSPVPRTTNVLVTFSTREAKECN
jgi:hypothetical protein